MAAAMTAALEDASGLFPWSIMHLLPPDDALYANGWGTLLSALLAVPELIEKYYMWVIVSFLTRQVVIDRAGVAASVDFIHFWGRLTSEYVGYAVREPEGFSAYRQRRQGELGIRLSQGAEASGL